MAAQRLSASARRVQLLETARGLFLTSGLGATSMRDIGQAAGVNTALLYRHFDSREDLIDEAVAQPLVEALDGLMAVASEASAYVGSRDVQRSLVSDLVERLLAAMSEMTPLLGVVLFSERGARFHRERLAPAIATIAAAADVSSTHLQHREHDTDVVARMIVGTCLVYGLQEMYEGPSVDRTAVASALTDLIFDGLDPR